MVVMGHVLTMCIRGIDSAALFKIIGEVHMPLFFFISGYLGFRRLPAGTVSRPPLGRRALRLLLPMLAVSTLWIYYFPVSGIESPLPQGWGGLWGDMWKNGYWFTLVLFEILIVYRGASFVLDKVRGIALQTAIMLAIWLVLSQALRLLPEQWVAASSLELTVRFFPVFIAGALAADHREAFARFVAKSTVQTVCLPLAFILVYYVGWYWRFPAIPAWCLEPARPLLHIVLSVIAFGCLSPWAACNSLAVRIWCFLGRKSLAIYLLHYFFLFPLGCIRPALEAMSLSFVPLLAVSASVAAMVIAVVLAADYLISFSAPLSALLTGSNAAKNRNNAITDSVRP